MVISSRTPEGTPNRCVLCGRKVRLEPSTITLDGPCPHCGHLLWFTKPARVKFRRGETWAYTAGAFVRAVLQMFAAKWTSVS
jgi:hypothetical protein